METDTVTQTCHSETAENYDRVVAIVGDGIRVIEYKDCIQWIIQRRMKGGAERPWRALHYCRTRKALIRLCATENPALRPEMRGVLDALPEIIGGRVH